MTLYHFRAVTADDRSEAGRIEAATPSEAAQALLKRGLFPLAISKSSRTLGHVLSMSIGRSSLSVADTCQLLADLSHLAAAGVEIAEALEIVGAMGNSPLRGEAVRQILEGIRGGKPLSLVLGQACPALPPHATAVVRASEASGVIAEGLAHVAEEMKRANSLKRQVQTALIYPACIAVAAAIAIIVLLVVVVPTLEDLFAEGASRLPWQTKALIDLSKFIRAHAFLLVCSAIASVAFIGWAIRTPVTRAKLERWTLKIPLLSFIIREAETARVARLLAILTNSRLPLSTALNLVRDGTNLSSSREALTLSETRLRQGVSLSKCLADVPALSARLITLVDIGETTGRLPAMLNEAARGAEDNVKTAIERFLTLLTPMMTIVFGFVAGFVLYAVMTAILSVNELAGH